MLRALRYGYVMMAPTLRGTRNVMTTARRCLPICSVDTNLGQTEIPKDFHQKLSRVIAETLGKDLKTITVSVRPDLSVCRSGTTDPAVTVTIWSIGVFDAERNPAYVKQLYDFIVPELNIAADRIVLALHPLPKESAGHLTYAEMFADQK